jgi:poly(3-hydroxybutyrate) depolymerase
MQPVRCEARDERVDRRRGAAVEEREPVVGVDEVHADRVRRAAEVEVDDAQRTHNAIFAVLDLPFSAMRFVVAVVAALAVASSASAMNMPVPTVPRTEIVLIHYRAHDGVVRPAWLMLPAGYHGQRIPLVISPHGRGVDQSDNALLWGDLPGEGGFAVIDPAGEGRRLHWYSWGAPAQIADLARMPALARVHGVNVDPHRIYAFGGSMGGQETLLLLAEYPHLLAGAAAFDPATDMARRYRDFAALPNGRTLQALARIEIGGTPAQDPAAYAARSPDHFERAIIRSGVPLQLYWSSRDRIIRDQVKETYALASAIVHADPDFRLWDFHGDWSHTAEMRWNRRLPRALARFGLLPWRDVPPLVTPAREHLV